MTNDKYNLFYYSCLTLFALFFLLINVYTPLLHDDFAYHFYYAENSHVIRPTAIPVTSLGQIITSMWHHYCCVNGRFTSHVILQLFSGLLGKGWAFNLCNTLVFAALLHLLVRLSSKNLSLPTLCAAFCAVFFFIPFPGQTMLWMSGSINYLWTMTFALAILYYIEKNYEPDKGFWKCLLAFLIGCFVGWMQESISISVSGALFFYLLKRRTLFRGTNLFVTLGFWLGTLLIVVSPGTFSRSGEIATQMNVLQMISSRLLGVSLASLQFVLPLATIIFMLFAWRRKMERLLLPLLVYFVSISFIYVLGMQEERLFFCTVIVCLWVILRYCNEKYSIKKPLFHYGLVAVLLCISAPRAWTAFVNAKTYDAYMNHLTQSVLESPSRAMVEIPIITLDNIWVMATRFSSDRYDFHNRVRAFYYEKESLQYLLPELYKDVLNGEVLMHAKATDLKVVGYNTRKVYEYADNWLMVVDSTFSSERLEAVYSVAIPDDTLSLRQRIIRYLLHSQETEKEAKNAYTLDCTEGTLLFVPKQEHLKSVQIKRVTGETLCSIEKKHGNE